MQTWLLVLGIVLTGQLGDPRGSRYASVPVGTPPAAGAAASGSDAVAAPPMPGQPSQPLDQPLGRNRPADQSRGSNQLRGTSPPASTPASMPLATGSATTGSAVAGSAAAGSSATGSSAAGSSAAGSSAAGPTSAEPHNPQPHNPQQSTGSGRLAKVTQPAELLTALAKAAGTEQLAGAPLSLETAVRNAGTRAQQTRRVQLYWELSQAAVQHQLASLEAIQLSSIFSGLGLAQSDQAWQLQPWQLAQQSIAARSQVARSAVKVAQLRLLTELGSWSEQESNSPDRLPLPSDLPYCGPYQTHFEEIFRGNPSAEAEQLSQLLPLLHQELGQRAADTLAAHQWYNAVSQQRSPQSDGIQLLKAYEYLALQRRAFVATAYQYNAHIARYTALAVPQEVGTVRLVAMLIESEPRSSADLSRPANERSADRWQSGAIRRATAEQGHPDSRSQAGSQQTFAEQERSRALRVPANRQQGEEAERSILVPPGSPQR